MERVYDSFKLELTEKTEEKCIIFLLFTIFRIITGVLNLRRGSQ